VGGPPPPKSWTPCQSANPPNRDSRCRGEVRDGSYSDTCLGVARNAGPENRPTILLLHGLPSSSRRFEPLFDRLAGRYHLVAPDYPGFGHSDRPDPKEFAYTFDHPAEIMTGFTDAIGIRHYTLYMQDYGGPVGFRMAWTHPERVEALIVQNAVAHNSGLAANWKARRAFWSDRHTQESALRENLLSLAAARRIDTRFSARTV